MIKLYCSRIRKKYVILPNIITVKNNNFVFFYVPECYICHRFFVVSIGVNDGAGKIAPRVIISYIGEVNKTVNGQCDTQRCAFPTTSGHHETGNS